VRRERTAFVTAALALWLLFVIQAVNTPVVLDDWFQLRYWRDHDVGVGSLWAYARHNYLHYNPRLGEVLLAFIDSSRAIHIIVTPLVQVAVLPIVFAIAFGRWPRARVRDLQLLLFIQTMIWLVIPIPGIIYFYRPIATNYLWAFTITLALFVPYRFALAGGSDRRRLWLAPLMLVLGWAAGMCNEHTGPAAMVAMAGFLYLAWRARKLRAWMVAGMVGLYIGYPMLFFAPGQAVRYGGLATRDTPATLLAERGVTGCLGILGDFVYEARLAILLFIAAVASSLVMPYLRRRRVVLAPRRVLVQAGILVAAAGAIVATLFASPTASDRLFYAPGVLLVAAFATCAPYLFRGHLVRRFVVVACVLVSAYHAVRFVEIYAWFKHANDERLALLANARPGTVTAVPVYEYAGRSRWHFGDDFIQHPWLADYVGRELFDLGRVDLGRQRRARPPHFVARLQFDPPRLIVPKLDPLPTYRQLQASKSQLAALIAPHVAGGLERVSVRSLGLYDDPRHRPLIAIEWSESGFTFVDGRPYDEPRGHFIRVRGDTLPKRIDTTIVVGCGIREEPRLVREGNDVLIPVDERYCRGPFTAILCEPDRCWMAGWY
jgi:hypothetical protein